MAWIAGVDGCQNGWFIVSYDTDAKVFEQKIIVEFKEILELRDTYKVITVDMPIGLLDQARHGGRPCDPIARKWLKAPRASSVFSPPVRQVLVRQALKQAPDKLKYEEALQINRANPPEENIGISTQCFGILPKILEIDNFMTPERQKIIKEIHPELCFYEMNRKMNKDVAASHNKSTHEGIDERLKLLQSLSWIRDLNVENIYNEIKNECKKMKCKVKKDDILDAYAALWTAKRIYNCEAIGIPANPDRDSRGLLMEIWR